MKQRIQHQGGWAATFVIVGIVLALGVAGGIYYLKTHSGQNDVATTDDGASSEIERALDDASKDTENKDDASTDDQGAASDASNSTAESDTSKDDTSSSDTEVSPDDSTKLPETGPADALAQIIAVAVLTTVSVAYIRSR